MRITLRTQGRCWPEAERRSSRFSDESEQALVATSQGSARRQHALNESTPSVRLRPEACLPRNHGWPDCPLGVVVGRLHPVDIDESPHGPLGPQDSAAQARRAIGNRSVSPTTALAGIENGGDSAKDVTSRSAFAALPTAAPQRGQRSAPASLAAGASQGPALDRFE